jgi:hypothetical protein
MLDTGLLILQGKAAAGCYTCSAASAEHTSEQAAAFSCKGCNKHGLNVMYTVMKICEPCMHAASCQHMESAAVALQHGQPFAVMRHSVPASNTAFSVTGFSCNMIASLLTAST